MEGDGMSAADKIKEADWRLFRSRLPIWQEAYMERLNREYIALLSGTGSASEKFWELERRMREDKRRGSVVMRMSCSNMELNLLSLLSDGVISTASAETLPPFAGSATANTGVNARSRLSSMDTSAVPTKHLLSFSILIIVHHQPSGSRDDNRRRLWLRPNGFRASSCSTGA